MLEDKVIADLHSFSENSYKKKSNMKKENIFIFCVFVNISVFRCFAWFTIF